MAKRRPASVDADDPQEVTVEATDHDQDESQPNDKEFGTIPFQELCKRCKEGRMLVASTQGPIAYMRCNKCENTYKRERPWRPKEPNGTPNVAARNDMI